MDHFAQLDSNNVVTNVIVVSDDDTSDISGVESKQLALLSVNKSLVPILTGRKPLTTVVLEETMQVLDIPIWKMLLLWVLVLLMSLFNSNPMLHGQLALLKQFGNHLSPDLD